MPLYDYKCAECDTSITVLTRSHKTPPPVHCGKPAQKQVSTGTSATFAKGGFSSSSPGGIN